MKDLKNTHDLVMKLALGIIIFTAILIPISAMITISMFNDIIEVAKQFVK